MSKELSPIESALVTNDLSKLTTEQRLNYYRSVCESVGLNSLTQPLSYINLNGKLTLYAKRDATDQLRKIHKVSINISERQKMDDIYIVTAKASLPDGREDEATGAVSIIGLKGDALANALLKCESKAKRRVTLSICGLGMLDETEVETVPNAVKFNEPQAQAPQQIKEPEIKNHALKTTISKSQAEFLKSTGESMGFSVANISAMIFEKFGLNTWKDLTQEQLEQVIKLMEASNKAEASNVVAD